MFKRTNPTRNPSGSYNILGNPQPTTTTSSNNNVPNPQGINYGSNLVENLDGETTERQGNLGRVNSTTNQSSLTIGQGIHLDSKQPSSIVPSNSQHFASTNNVFATV